MIYYLKNRLANWSVWLTTLLMMVFALLLSFSFLPTLSHQQNAIVSYEEASYRYCLYSQVTDNSGGNEFTYFDGAFYVYTQKNGTAYKKGYLNTFVLMNEQTTNYALSPLVVGQNSLGAGEIGLTRSLAQAYGIALGSKLYFPTSYSDQFLVKAIYEDTYGFFQSSIDGQFGYFLLGYQPELSALGHHYLRFVSDYPSGQIGPLVYLKTDLVNPILAARNVFLARYSVFLVLGLIALSFFPNLERLLSRVPHCRIYGYGSWTLFKMVFIEESIKYLLILLTGVSLVFGLALSLFAFEVFALALLGAYLLDLGLFSFVGLSRRN
jgi:hypothetical protein